MTPEDLHFITRVHARGLILDPVLECGIGYDGPNCKSLIKSAGMVHIGTDLAPGTNVDIAANLESSDDLHRFAQHLPFGTALVLNVIEHTFDPIRVLDNVLQLIRPGGTLVAVTPAVWPLHEFPFDAWRPLPDFYEEYAKRRGVTLIPDFFEYVGRHKIRLEGDGLSSFPLPGRAAGRRLYSRIVHRLFNTTGRSMFFPSHVAVGCVFQRPPDASP